jgi:hypothetical protein
MIVHWPNGFKSKGEIRSQFCHVIDVAPTVLEAAKLPQPTLVNGVMQEPMHGSSMIYSFDDAKAPERHETQYFEMFCNRGIYHKGWTAVTRHGTVPWVMVGPQPPLDQDVWELYDTTKDWSQAHDLAKQMPEKVLELQRVFDSNGMVLAGGNNYRLNLPPNIPAANFWSVTLYEAENASGLANGQPFPSLGSRDKPAMNADGSIELYLGPKAPAGKESNWLATPIGKGYFAILRLYAPTEAAINNSWKPGDIEKTK